MKTDALINMLSTDVERVDTRRATRIVRIAIISGLVGVLGIGILVFGIRWDALEPAALRYLLLKIVFAAAVVVVGYVLLSRFIRPGGEFQSRIGAAWLPFVAILVIAVGHLAFAPTSHWDDLLTGKQWLECLISIPIIAIVPFAAIMWAVRLAAPTDLVRTGALVGLVAGGVSAAGYALHCTDDSLPFIAVWYGGTIALCTLAGAALGPRFLRW
jgi:hypothetical protein